MTPIVTGAFVFIVAHVADLGTPISAGIGVCAATAAWLSIAKPWQGKSEAKTVDFDDEDYDNEASAPVPTKKKKKKRTGGTQKKKKKSSYDDDLPKEVEKEEEVGEDGLTKSQRRRAAKKAAKKAKKAAAAAEEKKKPKLSKKQRQKLRRKEKEALEAAKEAEKRELDEGWEVSKQTKKNEEAKMQASMRKIANEAIPDGEEQAEIYVDVPRAAHARIIGSKGSTKIAIQDATGTEIRMPKRDGASTFVTITGPASGCKKAKEAIEQLVAEGISSITHPGHVARVMPAKNLGLLIGPKGANIRALQSQCGIKIDLPEKDDDGKRSGKKEIKLSGPAEGVAMAEAAINDLYTQGFCSITHPGWVRSEMACNIDRSNFPELMGKGGGNINRIQTATSTRVKIPNSSSINQNIIISGEASNVETAKEQLRALLAEIAAGPVIHPEWAMNEAHDENDDWA